MAVIYTVSAMVGACFIAALFLRICNRLRKNRKKKEALKRQLQRETAKEPATDPVMNRRNRTEKWSILALCTRRCDGWERLGLGLNRSTYLHLNAEPQNVGKIRKRVA
ncbi:uncharacterized protein LOC144356196 [Saccoglossus kowalevskii]